MFIIIATLLGLSALFALRAATGALRQRRLLRAGGYGSGSALLGVTAALFGSVALNLFTYQRMTLEQPVADIGFRELAPQRYAARLRLLDGSERQLELNGDEWQLDARVLKWRGFATLLGLEPLYRLERLSGRYASAREELDKPRTVHRLSPEQGLDLWASARRAPDWLPWADAIYGSATFLPMRDGAVYRVSISTSGLVARPSNPVAAGAIAEWD